MTCRVILLIAGALCLPAALAEGRTWTSSDGAFSVDAELVEVRADGILLLRRGNGQHMRVPVARLSQADQQFVRELPKAGMQPPPGSKPPSPPQQQPASSPQKPKRPTKKLLPVPDADAVARRIKEVQDLLKSDYQRAQGKPVFRKELCGKLTNLARESLASDPVAAYTMANEAAAVAAEGGDLTEAIRSITWLSERFAISDSAARKAELVRRIKVESLPAETLKELVLRLQSLIEEAEDAADYDLAVEFGKVASRAARKSKDQTLISNLQARAKRLKDQQEFFEAAVVATRTLEKIPQDAEAQGKLGQFQCFLRGKWDEGLPRLAAGSDPEIAALAKRDLARPGTAREQIALADAWWTLGASPQKASLPEIKRRAAFWYQQAAPQLTALDKLRAETRIADATRDRNSVPGKPAGVMDSGGHDRFASDTGSLTAVKLVELEVINADRFNTRQDDAGLRLERNSVTVGDKTVDECATSHTLDVGATAHVDLRADKEYVVIQGGVVNQDTSLNSAVMFSIFSDKKQIWKSPRLSRRTGASFKVSIKDARVVTLGCENVGRSSAMPAWVAVTVLKKEGLGQKNGEPRKNAPNQSKPPDTAPASTKLADLPVMGAEVFDGSENRTYTVRPDFTDVQRGSVRYPQAFFMHPVFDRSRYLARFSTEQKYDTLQGTVFNNMVSAPGSRVIFHIVADDRRVWQSPPVGPSVVVPFRINIKGAQEIQLIAEGVGSGGSQPYWASVTLTKK